MIRLQRLLLLVAICLSATAQGHEIKPALLQLTEVKSGTFDVLWKRPVTAGKVLHLMPIIDGRTLSASTRNRVITTDAEITRWRALHAGQASTAISIDGLDQTISDVLLVIDFLNGDSVQTILTPENPTFNLDSRAPLETVTAYLRLGIEHILTGADHLMFVLGLLLLLRGPATLLKTVTAFTVAHSITLAIITLGHVRPNAPLIETLVALSIVFVAVEVVKTWRGEKGLMLKFPWLIAFVFGLLHGSAFGGELLQIGLPADSIVTALLMFNLGIEIGQLVFIALVFVLYRVLHAVCNGALPGAQWTTAYAIGAFGAMWFFERLGLALQIINV